LIDLQKVVDIAKAEIGADMRAHYGEDVSAQHGMVYVDWPARSKRAKGGIWIYDDGTVFCNARLKGFVRESVYAIIQEIKRQESQEMP
jgi:hypothetical protein